MRVFVGLDIDEAIRERIHRLMDEFRPLAPSGRWVRPESLHVTLKFIGEQPEKAVEKIKAGLAGVKGSPVEIAFRDYGFFPNEKSARVFWIGIGADARLARLAAEVDDVSAKLGIPREDRPFSPHLTLARGSRGSGAPGQRRGDTPNRQFESLQARLAAGSPIDFGTMTAVEFVLYQSQLTDGGSRYTKIARFPLVSESS
jgi:2'-5' RNA ligase